MSKKIKKFLWNIVFLIDFYINFYQKAKENKFG